ncbi:unnamed protein product [Sphagnum troendelagicum]
MVTSTQDTFKASSDGASRSNEVSILAGETYDDKLTPEEDHGDVSDEHKIATCIPKEAREAASDPEEPLPQAIRDQRSEDDLRSYLNSIFEKIGDGADEAKNAKYGEIEELGVSPGLARRGRVYNKALGEAKEGSAIEASLLRTLEIDEQLATCLRAGTSCRKISCWAARYNMVNIAMALVRRNIAMALVAGKPDPLPEEVLAIAVEYGHVQLVERLTKLQHGVDVNRGRWDFPGAGWWTNAGAGAVPRRLTDDWHLNEFERHGFKFLVPICSAARMGNVQMVKTLSECDKITDVEWALHWAAIMGHHHVVLELLNSKREVDVNKPVYNMTDPILRDACSTGSHVFNPLHIASFYGHGHDDLVKILLERHEVEPRPTLCKAVKLGLDDVVLKLLKIEKEMDVNTLEQEILDDPQDRLSFGKEFNPLHLASLYGHVKVVQALCTATTLRANMESGAGMTAFQIARRKGRAEIENFLLDRTDVQKYLDRLYRDRQVHVDAANAILVGATLIASVTFAAWLQPPLGYSDFYGSTSVDVAAPLPSGMYPSFVSVAGHPILDIFWIFNSMSFLFAIATLMVGANAARPPRQDKDIGEVVRTLRTLLSLAYRLLSVSVGCVLGAFATAGFVVLPPVRRYTVTMGATLGIGLVVVFLSWTSSWISSKVLYVLKIIKEFFSNNP